MYRHSANMNWVTTANCASRAAFAWDWNCLKKMSVQPLPWCWFHGLSSGQTIQHLTQHFAQHHVGWNVGSFDHHVGSPNIVTFDVGWNLTETKNVGWGRPTISLFWDVGSIIGSFDHLISNIVGRVHAYLTTFKGCQSHSLSSNCDLPCRKMFNSNLVHLKLWQKNC